MILPQVRDPRLVTLRRGGSLTDADHRALASWAAMCAEHVLPLFEDACPDDARPREAIEAIRSWIRGEKAMMATRAAGGHAMGAARPLRGAPRFAAYAAGQAAVVAHVPEHDLGAAAYAIKAAMAAADPSTAGRSRSGSPRTDSSAADPSAAEAARLTENAWQVDRIPAHLRELVLSDEARRNDICWSVFAV